MGEEQCNGRGETQRERSSAVPEEQHTGRFPVCKRWEVGEWFDIAI